MPVPSLADHLDTADGPSDEKGEKDAKLQRSEPTTPISTTSRPPHEYDEVMGITQVEPREAERFEEGIEPEFQDAEEVGTGETGEGLETGIHESGAFHGGFGSATLQECLDRINQSRTDAPATCHSGVKIEGRIIQPAAGYEPKMWKKNRSMKPLLSKDHHQMTSHNLESKKRERKV